MVFASKARMLSIKVGELKIDRSGPTHVASLRVELSSKEGMDDGEEQNHSRDSDAGGQQ